MTTAAIQESALSETRSVDMFYGRGEWLFGAAAPEMVRLGWSVFPQERDRRPGKVDGDMIKWSEDHGLIERLPSREAMDKWVRHCPTLNVALVFGPGSGNAFGIDIDVSNREICARIQLIAFRIMGRTPFRRIGSFPKIALLYRCSPDDPVPSRGLKFVQDEMNENKDGLDILGAGKLLTVHGVHHRTGLYFSWVAGRCSPLTHSPEDLPLVSSEQVRQFIEEVGVLRPYVQSAGGNHAAMDGIAWGSAEANKDVRVPRIRGNSDSSWTPDDEGFVVDGREAFMSALVYQTVRGNQERLLQLQGGESAELDGFVAAMAVGAHEEFCSTVRLGGRFTETKSRREILDKIRHLTGKFLAGGVKFSSLRDTKYEDRRAINPERIASPAASQEVPQGLMSMLPRKGGGNRKPIARSWLDAPEDGGEGREIQMDRSPIASVVQAGLREAFDSFFGEVYQDGRQGPGRLHVLLAPTGAGKTSQCIRYIAMDPRTYTVYGPDEGPGPIVKLLPTYANIAELRGRAQVLNLDANLSDEELVAAARGLGLLSEEQGMERAQELRRDAMSCAREFQRITGNAEGLRTMIYSGKLKAGCRRKRSVEAALAAGVGTSVLCVTPGRKDPKTGKMGDTVKCRFHRDCKAILQKEDIKDMHVVFMPHSFLALQIPDELEKVRAVIADERVHHLFLHTDNVSVSSLRNDRKMPRVRKRKEGQKASPLDDPEEMTGWRRDAVDIVLGELAEGKCPADTLLGYSRADGDTGRTVTGQMMVEAAIAICSGSLQRSGEIHASSTDEEVEAFCRQPQGFEIRQEKKLWEILKERMAQLHSDRVLVSLERSGTALKAAAMQEAGRPQEEIDAFRRQQSEKLDSQRLAHGSRDFRIQLLTPTQADGGRGEERIRLSWRDRPNWIDAPTLLLDASAQEAIVRKIWNKKPWEFVLHDPVQDVGKSLNVRIVGIVNATFSNNAIASSASGSAEERIKSARTLAKVRMALSTIAGWAGGRVVAGGSILARELLTDGWMAPRNVDWCHFGAMRGLDMFKHHSCAFSVGRMEVPVETIDGLVAALSYDDLQPEQPFDRLGNGIDATGETPVPLKLPETEKRVRLRGGQDAILKVPGYPPVWAETGRPAMPGERKREGEETQKVSWASIIQKQYREEELLQFVGRLRPVYREGVPPVWFAFSSILPDGLIVDDLLDIDDLMKETSGPLWDAARRTGGILEPSLLQACSPHLFGSPDAVAGEMARLGFDDATGEMKGPQTSGYGIVRWREDGDEGEDRHVAFVPAWMGDQAVSLVSTALGQHLGVVPIEIGRDEGGPAQGMARRKRPDGVDLRIGPSEMVLMQENERLEEIASGILDLTGPVTGGAGSTKYAWRCQGKVEELTLAQISASEAIRSYWIRKSGETTRRDADLLMGEGDEPVAYDHLAVAGPDPG